MAEELLESEAVEDHGGVEPAESASTRRLPVLSAPAGELSLWRDEAKAAALVAGAGIVAGAASVVIVRATRGLTQRRRPGRGLLRREPRQRVVASRSFLIDVHLLGSK